MICLNRIIVVVLLLLLAGCKSSLPTQSQASKQDAEKFNAQGYRIAFYRSAINTPPEGVIPLDDKGFVDFIEQHKSHACGSILLDVSPDRNAVFFADAQTGQSEWVTSADYQSIKNSHWLINVGFGELKPDIEQYYRQSLAEITKQNKICPVAFFCQGDCWMGWNASKRALSWGYQKVYWYNHGTDGWQQNGYPLYDAQPYILISRP